MRYRLTADATFIANSPDDALGWLMDIFGELYIAGSDALTERDLAQLYHFDGHIKVEPAEEDG